MSTTDQSGRSKGKILIVDDTPGNLRLLTTLLNEHGYMVYPVDGAMLALRFLESTLPDLILLDILMPEMDGFQLCQQLKADERLRDIPVIFISAAGQVLDKVRAFAVGGVDYVGKPFQVDEVLARIETHLSLRRLQQRLEERVRERTAALTDMNVRLQAEIAERSRAEEALRLSKESYHALYDDAPLIYLTVSPSGTVLSLNRFGMEQLGRSGSVVMGSDIGTLFTSEDRPVLAERLAECAAHASRVFQWELPMVHKDGHLLWVRQTARSVREPGGAQVLLIIGEDISERKQAEARIRHLAHHDSLTGLPNRSLLEDRINLAIAQAQRHNRMVAVLFLDLDYFKRINDSLGHQFGDRLLQRVAVRLQQCLRKSDSVARLGGDEFVVMLPGLIDSDAANQTAQKMLAALSEPFEIDGQTVHVSASIGVSIFPADGADADALLRTADTAMYFAKDQGRANHQFFVPMLDVTARRRLKLENRLRSALTESEFTLYYQPQVELGSNRIFSAEALLRWQPPGKDPIACAEFIEVAEETGLIVPLGEWALRQACELLNRCRRAGYPQLRIAVNLSARQLYQRNFEDSVAHVLGMFGLPPEALELEITESLLVQPSDDNVTVLKRLNDMGVRLAVDDFGTGYSSLAYLQRFPIRTLKIDRSFVAGIGRNLYGGAIASAVITLAQNLRLNVVAEGVETPEQADFLKAHGCGAAQGHYYSVPVPADKFVAMLPMRAKQTA